MPKPYSQDLRDRVIDAVERGKMSRRAAARRYEISESVAIKWLERVERKGSREPVSTPEQDCIAFRSKDASMMPTRMPSSTGLSWASGWCQIVFRRVGVVAA